MFGDAVDTLQLDAFDPGRGAAYQWTLAAADGLRRHRGGGFDLQPSSAERQVLASLAVDADIMVLSLPCSPLGQVEVCGERQLDDSNPGFAAFTQLDTCRLDRSLADRGAMRD